MPIPLLVLGAAFLHAIWNALLKQSGDRLLSLAFIAGAGSAASWILIPFAPRPHPDSFGWLGLSVLFHIGYYTALVRAYDRGDLSLVYPVARGSGPLWVALVSGPLANERLTGQEGFGVAVLCSGIVLLALRSGGHAASRSALLYALVTGLFIGCYTLSDGLGVRVSGHPIAYILWMNGLEGIPLFLFAMLRRRRRVITFLREDRGRAIAGGILAALAYGVVIWTYSKGTIAPIAALRETSVVIAAWLGSRHLGEPFGRSRLLAAAIVATGVLLLSF